MKNLSTDDLRQSYLDFFQSKGHAVIPGASLIPENDPTVLFTTAGMHPLVPYLLGESHPKGTRLVDCQKCIRTGDIDEVGDSSHLTFFEMMGNWSLGDYFKEESIRLSFEFLTKVLEIPASHLSVTCFEGDDDAPRDTEAFEYWKAVGMPEDRIGFLPKKDNWWGPAGQTGPCGPDTEIFYWVGEGEPHGNPSVNEDDWMEIWNNVFMQYNKTEDGTFEPLVQQNVDTGLGLERVAAVLQGVANVYETDKMQVIVKKVKSLIPDTSTLDQRHLRIIVDHLKASVFIITDGITPSNVDQGYVLRKLIRRAIRSAKQLGISSDSPITPTIAETIIDEYSSVYGELRENKKHICDTLVTEEKQFEKSLTEGLKRFSKISEDGTKNITGTDAFHLYDTYGFPLELTKEMAAEYGLTVDEEGFQKSFEEHQAKSRAGAEKKFSGGLADHSDETTKLHTATHLLNAALRTVLGDHIWQKGSNITAERLRFDFSHDEKMTREQIDEVEKLVNDAIAADLPVSYHTTTVEGAKDEGAIGVFDDRYDTDVKVYVMGEGDTVFSREICGGPHVARTSMLGSFKIKKEESSSAGVRRIKAQLSGGPESVEVAGKVDNE